MTVSELIDKLKDCAPGATVQFQVVDCRHVAMNCGEYSVDVIESDGEAVFLS